MICGTGVGTIKIKYISFTCKLSTMQSSHDLSVRVTTKKIVDFDPESNGMLTFWLCHSFRAYNRRAEPGSLHRWRPKSCAGTSSPAENGLLSRQLNPIGQDKTVAQKNFDYFLEPIQITIIPSDLNEPRKNVWIKYIASMLRYSFLLCKHPNDFELTFLTRVLLHFYRFHA